MLFFFALAPAILTKWYREDPGLLGYAIIGFSLFIGVLIATFVEERLQSKLSGLGREASWVAQAALGLLWGADHLDRWLFHGQASEAVYRTETSQASPRRHLRPDRLAPVRRQMISHFGIAVRPRMKAIVITGTGGPETLKIREVPTPEPRGRPGSRPGAGLRPNRAA